METIPARHGKALRLNRGQSVKVINTHGSQVVDSWAFRIDDPHEFMSMEHTRVGIGRLIPRPGDQLLTNRRRPILTLTKDTSPGVHDTLIAACDHTRYELLGCEGYHRNCQDNLFEALAELGLTLSEVPSPLNLFMNIPVRDDLTLGQEPPVSRPGDYVTLRAEVDCVVALSACPQDMTPINGPNRQPTEAHYEILG